MFFLHGAIMTDINLIVIHCAASKNGSSLANSRETAAQVIDRWHRDAGFRRAYSRTQRFNPTLKHIGYHYVIDTDGSVETGREIGETGAHVSGFNTGSVGICLIGTDAFTPAQWHALRQTVESLQHSFPKARICGHRDLSPDINHDGKITPNEYIKICPGFTVADWLQNNMQPLSNHIVRGDAQ